MVFNVAPNHLDGSDGQGGGNGEAASYVIGQPSLDACSAGTSQTTVKSVDDMAYDVAGKRLFASDLGNNRVLVFDVSPSTLAHYRSLNQAEPASYVLGQSDFDSGGAGSDRSHISNPTGEAYDAKDVLLFVDDYDNNRVLAFDVSTATLDTYRSLNQAEPAAYVLGQSSFSTNAAATTQNGLDHPDDNAFDDTYGRLFVADRFNARVLIYNIGQGISNDMNAQAVFGEPNFTSADGGVGQSIVAYPNVGDVFDPAHNKIFVSDLNNNRVLQFSMIDITTPSVSNAVRNVSYSQAIAIDPASYQGSSQTFSVQGGSLPSGLTLNSSTGVISGIPTTAGTYTFTVEADDNFTDATADIGKEVFFDRASYSMTVEIPTTTVLTSSSSTSTYDQNVTFKATVMSGSTIASDATGTIQFMDGASALGPAVTISRGSGSYTTSTLSVATHSLTGVYSGDDNYLTSTSDTLTQTVNAASSSSSSSPTSSLSSTPASSPPPISSGGSRHGVPPSVLATLPSSSASSSAASSHATVSTSSVAPSLTPEERAAIRLKLRKTHVSLPPSSTASASSSGSFSYRVRIPYLNFRADSRLNAFITDVLTKGMSVTVLRFVQGNQWAEVRLQDGRTGYVWATSLAR